MKAVFSVSARHEKRTATVLAYQGLEDLQRLTDWTRMWSFQEYHLPKEPVSFCDSHVFTASMPRSKLLDQIHDALEVPMKALIDSITKVPSPVRKTYLTGPDGQGMEEVPGSRWDQTRDTEHWESIRDLISHRFHWQNLFFTRRRQGFDTRNGKVQLISYLLRETCHHSSTDPCDKFFALRTRRLRTRDLFGRVSHPAIYAMNIL